MVRRSTPPIYGPTFGSAEALRNSKSTRAVYKLIPPFLFPASHLTDNTPWYQEELPGAKLARAVALVSATASLVDNSSDTEDEKDSSARASGQRLRLARSKLWALDPSPWAGRWTFLIPGLAQLPWYNDTVVVPAKAGGIIIDIGCGIGGDVRKLLVDIGRPGTEANNVKAEPQLYAVDSRPEMWDVGDELFGIEPRIKFLKADAFDSFENGSLLSRLHNKADVIVFCLFLDQFHWYHQLDILVSAVRLSKVGTQVVGYSLGSSRDPAGEYRGLGDSHSRMYHSPLSFKTLWFDLECKTQTTWTVDIVEMVDLVDLGWEKEDSQSSVLDDIELQALHFVVTREN
jgi:SAM-dependent methyltransferase